MISAPARPPVYRTAAGVCLVILLVAVYFFTFNGYMVSRDEGFLFDATESVARQGNFQQNYQFDAYPPTSLATVRPPSADAEPLQPVLAAGLVLIAQVLPGIGLIHAVWLFNVLVTALTAGVLYAYGLALGYSVRVSVSVALVFGLATIAWPYSRTFFREPLFTALALLAAYLILRLRQVLASGERSLLILIALALACAGALFSKEASLLLLPAFFLEALPSRVARIRLTRREVLVLAGLAFFAGVLALAVLNADTLFGLSSRYNFAQRRQVMRENVPHLWDGISGYLFSPARSVWLFSPLLLLGFLGWPRLFRQRRWRQMIMPLVMLASFVGGYAAVRGAEDWYGGRGWGARYLVPVIPFLALWLLPVVEALFEADAARWKRWGAGLVVAVSAGIQLLAVIVPLEGYYRTLAEHNIVPWEEGAWSLRWSPIRVALDLLGDQPADVAWRYAAGPAWLLPVLTLALGAAVLGAGAWWVHHPNRSRRALMITTGSLGVLAALVLFGGLTVIRQDRRMSGDFEPLVTLLDQLEPQLQSGDVIVLNDPTYAEFFMNSYKRRMPVVYTLPRSPGERYSPEQPPEVESVNPEALIHPADTIILADLAAHHDRLWLVINSSRFVPWAVRPVEQYLTRHYFPVLEIHSTDIARAVLFDLTSAPSATAADWPSQRTGAVFGENLQLVGFDLPGGTAYRAGEVLPLSLLWRAHTPVERDYTVAVFLMAEDGSIVTQRDSSPANAFDPMTGWRAGSLHRDNHGLLIPGTAAPGEYDLWVVVYWWETPAERLPVSTEAGVTDHAMLARITVEP